LAGEDSLWNRVDAGSLAFQSIGHQLDPDATAGEILGRSQWLKPLLTSVVECLVRWHVEVVFGLPGDGI